MKKIERVEGLGGWLILVGIGLFFTPFRLAFHLFNDYKDIFEDGTWELLTSLEPGAEGYYLPGIIIMEIGFNLILLIGSIFILYLFFSKNHLFPKFYIIIFLISFFYTPLNAWLVSLTLPSHQFFDSETTREFIRQFVAGAIWVPYMLVSVRVDNTFIYDMSGEICKGVTKKISDVAVSSEEVTQEV